MVGGVAAGGGCHDRIMAAGIGSIRQEGYVYASLQAPQSTAATFDGMQQYFALPAASKQLGVRANQTEWGYRGLLPDKEMFIVRSAAVPPQLRPALPVWQDANQLVSDALTQIEGRLHFPPGALSNLLDLQALPATSPTASLLRLLHYPPRAAGLAADAHVDAGLLSYIPPSTVPALQIWDPRSDRWHQVERPGTDQGVLMVGETLSLLTHRYYCSCVHRVGGTSVPRLSMVFQARPRPDAWIDTATFGLGPQLGMSGAELLARLRSDSISINQTFGPPSP